MISSTLQYLRPQDESNEARSMPSEELDVSHSPKQDAGFHVAIIMDGNGRWARRRGRPRYEGHRAGAHAVRRVVETAPSLGVGTLTLYAFSADNWRRPVHEVQQLMWLFQRHLRSERTRCVREGVRVNVIGRRDRLPPALLQEIDSIESRTRLGRTLHLRLAIDYSSRDALLAAAAHLDRRSVRTREGFRLLIDRVTHAPRGTRDVDLLVRTGGEKRLSDFLLWESAYAEIVFTQRLWPDFSAEDLASAITDFRGRERRFGGLPAADVSEPRTPSRLAEGGR